MPYRVEICVVEQEAFGTDACVDLQVNAGCGSQAACAGSHVAR
jgi:hypothetical protein